MTPDRLRNVYSVISSLKNNNSDLKKSYNNYQNVVMLTSLKKKGEKKKNVVHFEGVFMR